MQSVYQLHKIARLPLPGDNVAIVTQRLNAGAQIVDGERTVELSNTLLEGHRFAVDAIATGEPLLSWNLPFGIATQPIRPGEYVCNHSMLEALSGRSIDFALPTEPNFVDKIEPYVLDEKAFLPAEQVSRHAKPHTFMGFRRGPTRGVGTRNFIVLLGTTSRTGSFVKQLEERLKGVAVAYPNVDGIVAAAHTEGGSEHPNNLDLLLRTLAGFMVNPNVGAVLAVDYGVEPVTNRMLHEFMQENSYPLSDVPHRFVSLTGSFQANLDQCAEVVKGWLDQVNADQRTPQDLAHLKIALQCGGSDAFSGISGNPLAAWVAKEVVRYGGSANLAETDELIGAESYVLAKVRNLETARRFLATVARFKDRVAWHGHTAEGNPSGGNKYRGLYNIVLKSIGAAMKKHPDVRLDYVIDYGDPMVEPGYYFMDSPGNDLESVAGQIAAGCNMIFFVTGNGSITNFPFVPTIKIVTTTRRYKLLSHEMDVNAGAYLDGAPMDELGAQMFDLTIDIASGMRSVGEIAGHAQVQIWRDWRQTDASHVAELLRRPQPTGASLPIKTPATGNVPHVRLHTMSVNGIRSTDMVGLILPTSLCAGQVAQMTAVRLNQIGLGRAQHISRFVALVHTEGCGNSGGSSEELYIRTMLGYLTHPTVRYCLFLEHGCEKTHNDYMRHQILQMGLDPERFGWASIQLDGGIEKVTQKIEDRFAAAIQAGAAPDMKPGGLESLRLGLASAGPVSTPVALAFAQLAGAVAATGGSVVVPQNAGVLSHEEFLRNTLDGQPPAPSLAYGQHMGAPGFHIMETPTAHWVETLTGLGATGVEVIVTNVSEHPVQTHPLVPLVQISDSPQVKQQNGPDIDLALNGDPAQWPQQILDLIATIADHRYTPKLYQLGNIDFQMTRGLLGVSL